MIHWTKGGFINMCVVCCLCGRRGPVVIVQEGKFLVRPRMNADEVAIIKGWSPVFRPTRKMLCPKCQEDPK